jgi:hypothetical protein
MLSVRKQINKKTFTLILKFLLKIQKENPDFNDKEYFLYQLLNYNYRLFFKGINFISKVKNAISFVSESVLISYPQSISILKVFRKEYENIKIKNLQKAFDMLMLSMIEIKKRKIKNSLPNNLNKLHYPEEFLSQNIYQRTLYCLSVICKDMMSIARNEKNIRIAIKTLNEIYKIQPNLFTYFKKLDISSYMNEELFDEDGSETFFKDDLGNECENLFENHDYSEPAIWRKTNLFKALKIFQIKCKKLNILIPSEYLRIGNASVKKVK